MLWGLIFSFVCLFLMKLTGLNVLAPLLLIFLCAKDHRPFFSSSLFSITKLQLISSSVSQEQILLHMTPQCTETFHNALLQDVPYRLWPV